jgi:DnaD/phage-associated family protein
MGIIRTKKRENPFVQIDKSLLHDDRLSWKARGVLCYMLSMPDDWVFYTEELIKHAPDGIDSLKAAFKELKKYGYMKKYPIRDEKGKVTRWETIVFEHPEVENPLVGKSPEAGNPLLGKTQSYQDFESKNPEVDSPQVGNPPGGKSDPTNINSTNKQDTNNEITNKGVVGEEDAGVFFVKNFGNTSEFIAQSIDKWVEDFNSHEIVIESMKIALKNNASGFGYCETILRDWHRKGLRSIEAIRAYEANKKAKLKRINKRVEPIPKWMTDPNWGKTETSDEEIQKRVKELDSLLSNL